jgi:hypothetical protein
MQVVCHILLESSWWGLQLCFRPHLNQRSAQNVMGLQSHKSPNFENFGTPNLGIHGQNDIWVQALWPGTDNTVRGKVVTSPKSGPWWVLWVCVCSLFVRAPKVLQLCTNQLVIWFVWFVRIIDPLVTHPSPHPKALACPSTPEMLRTRERTPTLYPSIVFTLDS